MIMDSPQMAEPSFSQNRLPLIWTKTNIKDNADNSLTTPKMPVRNSEEDTEVNPADINIVGASIPHVLALLMQEDQE